MRALEAVRDALDLDYGGIDFALDAAGRVVVFEANATMVLIDPPADARWDYRRAPVDKAKKAFQRMLLAAAGRLADGPV
jgi:glutathione synthase/RimK-type ligase-like ATP-grasp enzyme